ncbi:MAG: pyruvate kinase [Candidatus Paceibacterota bacterium]|jgi:pyruvate kinase|nr:pyruvate kinase [Candidatus Paceibacterota bacterium]
MNIRKTKIVATIGPASCSERELTGMINAGMNVARLNFSHGSHEEHSEVIRTIRDTSEKLHIPVAILQDLSGPKIRIGSFETETVHLKKDAEFTLTTEAFVGSEERVYVNYKNLPKEVSEGSHIMLDDGKIKLRVQSVKGEDIKCIVVNGGTIRGSRGVNVPGTKLSIGCLGKKDKDDLLLGIREKVDFVALSFVQSAEDIRHLRKILDEHNSRIAIIAKIETEEAVKNIDEIIEVSDGIMIARGDLAVEIPAEEVPLAQKLIIKKSIMAGKPVITATQMLDSMIHSPVPTRAEVSDVSNAILDGTDAIMLSGETATGDHPVLTIETMSRIAHRTEESELFQEEVKKFVRITKGVADSVSLSVAVTAANIDAKAIIALSETGFTPRMISRYKPRHPIFVFTPHIETRNRALLSFGCFPELGPHFTELSEAAEHAKKFLIHRKNFKKGDKFVLCAGIPFGKKGSTNLMLAQSI